MKGARFAVVVSRFNEEVTRKLRASCVRTLQKAGTLPRDILVVEVPGAFEIPWTACELARSGRFDAVICLGAVLKGQTPQNTFISEATVAHIQRISIDTRVPCILGVITPNTYGQALARTRGHMDRGVESAGAALEMAALRRRLKGKR